MSWEQFFKKTSRHSATRRRIHESLVSSFVNPAPATDTHPLFVRMLVEIVEQDVEHDRVHQDEPDERLRVVTLDEQQLDRVYEHHDELHLDERKTTCYQR